MRSSLLKNVRKFHHSKEVRGITPHAMKKTCTCGGTFRLIEKEHVINTRIEHLREIVLKDIKFNQCKICGKTELDNSYEKNIENLKLHLSNKYFTQSAATQKY